MINYSQAVTLHKFRDHSQLTQSELAAKLQTTRSQISMAEKGLRPLSAISGRLLDQLVESFKVAQVGSSSMEQMHYSDEGIASFCDKMNKQLDAAIFKKLRCVNELEALRKAYPQVLAMYGFLKNQDVGQFTNKFEKDIHIINLTKWEKKI